MKNLIINGDDFGLTDGCSRGIIEAMKNGVVTSTTVMINMPNAEEAIELARENKITSLGLHLTLTCGKPILDTEEVQSLIDENGNFYKRSNMLLPVMNLDEVENELRAQINKFNMTRMKLSHFDSHHHIHMYGGIREIVTKLAKEYNVPVRQPNLDTKKLYEEMKIITTDYFTWDFYSEGATLDNFKNIVSSFNKGTMEIMCHPAFVDKELEEISSYNNYRRKELDILTNKQLKQWLELENVKLISFEDLS